MSRQNKGCYLLFLFALPCASYITRLSCKYHANFTIISDTKYNGTVQETHSTVSGQDCASLCLSRDTCSYVNYNIIDSTCHLLELDSGTEQSASGWKFYSTNYGVQNRGPFCQSYSPCPLTSACIDTCTHPWYQCIDNQFRKVTDAGYNSYPNTGGYPASNIADNDLGTFGNTGSDPNSWMSINLGFRSGIRFITVKIYSHANNYKLDIGYIDSRYGNKFCADVPSIIYKEIKVECSRYLIGQFIVLYHTSGTYLPLYIYELSAYIDV
ncbi:uncharacterized protein LOC130630339 [Hydractinia symbiolongicarpus]|uniref:uncharacterized protein LOC130630339 n=1 Tax=Hydractinia symbiolongicarpus TaxID=13093 RepID=UPI00254EE936|nr:uncharacterized protein LOC130630339 [Hydractinia symbiolongicarpus]